VLEFTALHGLGGPCNLLFDRRAFRGRNTQEQRGENRPQGARIEAQDAQGFIGALQGSGFGIEKPAAQACQVLRLLQLPLAAAQMNL